LFASAFDSGRRPSILRPRNVRGNRIFRFGCRFAPDRLQAGLLRLRQKRLSNNSRALTANRENDSTSVGANLFASIFDAGRRPLIMRPRSFRGDRIFRSGCRFAPHRLQAGLLRLRQKRVPDNSRALTAADRENYTGPVGANLFASIFDAGRRPLIMRPRSFRGNRIFRSGCRFAPDRLQAGLLRLRQKRLPNGSRALTAANRENDATSVGANLFASAFDAGRRP